MKLASKLVGTVVSSRRRVPRDSDDQQLISLYCRATGIRQLAMRTAREATERTIHLAALHIAQQEERIERQKSLIASLEAAGHAELAQAARQILTDMTVLLATMNDDLAQAEARWMTRG